MDDNSFGKILCFTFLPYKSIRDQIWPCSKIGQGQARVIIWTNLVVLKHPMLHTKFQGHQPFGSGEDFFKVLPYMGMVAILVMWPGPVISPSHGSSILNMTDRLSGFWGEECLKMLTHIHRWQRPTYPISSPLSLWDFSDPFGNGSSTCPFGKNSDILLQIGNFHPLVRCVYWYVLAHITVWFLLIM